MIGVNGVLNIMYAHLEASPLKGAISGVIRKGQRPLNSSSEDVVINTLPLTATQLQKCIVNVNVFVPDEELAENNAQDYEPKWSRLEELEQIALSALENKNFSTYHFTIQQKSLMKDTESKSHYINIRVEFYAPNLN